MFTQKYILCALKKDFHVIVPPAREKFFDQDFQKMLQQMHSVIYDPDDIVHVPMCYQEIKQVHIFGQLHSSLKSRTCRSAGICAVWPSLVNSCTSMPILCRSQPQEDNILCIGVVDFFFAMFQQYKQTQDQQKVCICLLKLNGLKTSHKFHI